MLQHGCGASEQSETQTQTQRDGEGEQNGDGHTQVQMDKGDKYEPQGVKGSGERGGLPKWTIMKEGGSQPL